jgi:hypothetical protein
MRSLTIFSLVVGVLFPLRMHGEAPPQLAEQVRSLPEATAAQKLKKATLLWALEDADEAVAAGFQERADATIADVKSLLPKDIGHPRPAPENLFPRKPAYQITTYPPAGSLEKSGPKSDRAALAHLLQGTFKKGPEGDVIRDEAEGWVAIRIAYEAEALAMALCHPESSYAGDPRLIAPMFRRFENAYEYMVPGNKKRLADFGPTPALSQMYLLLKTVYPDLILPSRQAAWENAIRLNCEAILESREALFAEAKPGTAYVNADIKYISGLTYAGLLFGDARYKQAAENGVRLIETAIYPDGASAYIFWQNEDFTYHGILVTELSRIAQVTGNPLALDLVKRTANYYPLSFVMIDDTNGVAEFSTAPSWKHSWNGMTPGAAGALVERYTGVRQAVPPPEKYFVYDRNIEGPRGRFGNFAFCGTARDLHNDIRGKDTYAGCMVFAPTSLSAALGGAGIEVKPKPGTNAHSPYNLSQDEHNATTVTKDFAALTSTHRLSAYNGHAVDWQGRQVWLFTPNRMVGLVCVESLKDQEACGVTGVLRFVSPTKSGEGIASPGPGEFKIGMLNTKIHSHDFSAIQADAAPSKFPRLTFIDKAAEAADGNSPLSYASGLSHYYLAEFYPDGSNAAESVRLLKLDGGLAGFAMKDNGRTYRVIFNPTERETVWRADPSDVGQWLHRSGEQYRPAWIGAAGKEEIAGQPAQVTAETVSKGISIPAFTHITTVSELPPQ